LFIVNPFSQRCGLGNREVQATDVCARFTAKPDPAADAGKNGAGDASSRFDALFGKESSASATNAVPTPVTGAPQQVPAAKKLEPQAPAEKQAEAKPSPKPKAKRAAAKPKATTAGKKPVGRPRKKAE